MPTTYSFEYNVPIGFTATQSEDYFTRDDEPKPVVLSFSPGGTVGPGDIEDLFGSGPGKGRNSLLAPVIKEKIKGSTVENTILGIINRDLSQPKRWSSMVVPSLVDGAAATATWNEFFNNVELIDSNAPLLNAGDVIQLIFIFRAPDVTPALSKIEFPVDIKFTMNMDYVNNMQQRLDDAISNLAGKTAILNAKKTALDDARNAAKSAEDALAALKQTDPTATQANLSTDMQNLLIAYGTAQVEYSQADNAVVNATTAKNKATQDNTNAQGKVDLAKTGAIQA
jgi:hypothetical protein